MTASGSTSIRPPAVPTVTATSARSLSPHPHSSCAQSQRPGVVATTPSSSARPCPQLSEIHHQHRRCLLLGRPAAGSLSCIAAEVMRGRPLRNVIALRGVRRQLLRRFCGYGFRCSGLTYLLSRPGGGLTGLRHGLARVHLRADRLSAVLIGLGVFLTGHREHPDITWTAWMTCPAPSCHCSHADPNADAASPLQPDPSVSRTCRSTFDSPSCKRCPASCRRAAAVYSSDTAT